MGLSSSTKKTKESGFRTESGTTTPVLPQPLQTGLTGLIDKTNQLAGEDPYGLVAGASGLQGQAFQAASTDLGGWQAPMKHAGQMVGEATGAAPAYANAFTYQAPQIGSAELGSVSAAQLPGLGGPTQMTAQSYQAPQLGGPASYQAQTAQTPQIGNVASYDVTGYAPQLASAQQAGFQSYNPVLSGAAAQAQSQQGQAALGAAAFGEASLGQASAAQASLASAQQAAASFGQAALMSAPRLAAAAQASGHGYDAAQAGRTELGAVSGYNPAQMQAAEAGRTLVDPIERVQAASLLDNLQAYQNPYERQVVDATLAGYDAQAGQAAAAMKAQAAKAGAFGGSRFGIAQGQFEADNSRNRALTQAQLLSQGFDRATALSQSDAANRQQAGLANQSAANSRSALQAQLDSTTDLANAGFRQQTNQANANWQNDASRFLADAGLQRILSQGNLDSQRELANAGFANSARQFNSDLGARLSMFNTEATNTRNLQQGQHDFGAAQTNANNLTQTSNSNAQLGTQASLTNAELGTRAAMANADRLTQTSNSNADRFTSMSNSNADRLTSTSNANADRLTQTSNSNARNLTDTSNANAELGTRTSIANMQSSNENSWRNMEASNRAAEFGASAFNANQNQNAQLGTQTNIQNAQFGNDAQSRFADSLNQRGRDEAGAINSRNTSQAQLDAQMGTFNIGQINQQLRDAGQWTNDFAKSNADYQAQALRDNVSAANRASELNSAAANQFALNRFEQQSAAARQFAGDSNQANLTRYTTDSQRAADQARLAAQASEFGANALNAQAQFNANQYDDGLQRQLQGAGIYGDLANNFAANMRGDIGLQAQLGEQQRQIQQQQLMARYAQLQALGELYKYGQPMVGQATTGNSNFSSNSVSKEKPSAFDMLMQVGERIGQAAAAGSDRRLKRDVERIGTLDSGLGLYRFNYHWDAKGRAPRTGVMADEVARLVPQALGPIVAGYGTVNYEALGLAHLVEG